MPIHHYLELLRQHRRLVAMMTLGTGAGAAVIALLLLLLMPVYTATASVTILPTEAELSYSRRFVSEGNVGVDPSAVMMQTHIEYLLSSPVAELTLQRLQEEAEKQGAGAAEPTQPSLLARLVSAGLDGLRSLYYLVNSGTAALPSPHDEAVAAIQNSLSIELVEGSYIMRIAASAGTPEAASQIANTVAQAYIERSLEVAAAAAESVTSYLKDELAKRQTQLDPQAISDLRSRLLEAELSRGAGMAQVRIIDNAETPLRPAFPKVVPMSVGGLVVGGLSAVLLIIIMDTFGRTASTSLDMTRIVGRRFLGRVPPPLAALAQRPVVRACLPLPASSAFTAGVAARLGLVGATEQPWVHVVGIGGKQTARQGAMAIAAAYASCDMPADLIVDTRERYRVLRERGELRVQPLSTDERPRGGPVITVGSLLSRPLLGDSHGQTHSATAPTQVVESTRTDTMPRSLVIAVAAGQAHEDLLTMLAVEGGPGERMFLLVP